MGIWDKLKRAFSPPPSTPSPPPPQRTKYEYRPKKPFPRSLGELAQNLVDGLEKKPDGYRGSSQPPKAMHDDRPHHPLTESLTLGPTAYNSIDDMEDMEDPDWDFKHHPYLRTWLSAPILLNDALELISQSGKSLPLETEEKILVLINAASANYYMKRKHSELAKAHRALGDCYCKHGIYLSALEQYQRSLELSPNLPMKQRMQILEKLPDKTKKSPFPRTSPRTCSYTLNMR